MMGNKTSVHTESKEKPAVHLEIKCPIDKFEPMMDSTEPGAGGLWSKGVTSKWALRAVWKLRIYPNGDPEQYKGNISVYLCLTGPMADKKETQQASFHLYLVDGSGKTDTMLRGTYDFGKAHYSGGIPAISHDRVKKALHADGSLVVAAEVDFLPPNDSGMKAIEQGALRDHEDRQECGVKFSELYGHEASSDCSIQIGGVTIRAHKSVLIPHSPIFHAMFTRPLAEEYQTGVIKITDFKDPEPMRAVISYCYLGHLDAATMDGKWAVETFKHADRYCIKELKAILERHFIEKRLSVKNVVVLAVLADTHSATKLKEACIQLIAEKGDAVFESADWKEVMKARPELTPQLAVGATQLLAKKRLRHEEEDDEPSEPLSNTRCFPCSFAV